MRASVLARRVGARGLRSRFAAAARLRRRQGVAGKAYRGRARGATRASRSWAGGRAPSRKTAATASTRPRRARRRRRGGGRNLSFIPEREREGAGPGAHTSARATSRRKLGEDVRAERPVAVAAARAVRLDERAPLAAEGRPEEERGGGGGGGAEVRSRRERESAAVFVAERAPSPPRAPSPHRGRVGELGVVRLVARHTQCSSKPIGRARAARAAGGALPAARCGTRPNREHLRPRRRVRTVEAQARAAPARRVVRDPPRAEQVLARERLHARRRAHRLGPT